MRIGIFDPYLDDLGGGEKYMMTLAECLSKDNEVHVFWDNQEDIDALKQRFEIDFSNIKRTRNIFSQQISFLERAKESRKYDALIVLSDGSIPLVFSKKLFLHIQQPLDQSEVTTLKGKIKLKRVNKIFYNSEFSRTFNKKFLGNADAVIIYPPVPLFAEELKKENMILHVGRFRVANVKNQDFKKQQVMVSAFKQMIDKGLKDWKFVIATSVHDTKEESFQKMIESAKGYPIKFEINKTNIALWDLYNRAKIYWHASGFGEDLEKHPNYAEHFGISTVEAMGAGVVPVAINAGGQKEIITDGENGLLWDTLDELEKKTKYLIKEEDEWKKMSEKAKVRAKDFSKEQFTKAVYDLLEKA